MGEGTARAGLLHPTDGHDLLVRCGADLAHVGAQLRHIQELIGLRRVERPQPARRESPRKKEIVPRIGEEAGPQ